MRKDLIWLVILLAVAAAAAFTFRHTAQRQAASYLCLRLASNSDFSHCATLTMDGRKTRLELSFPEKSGATEGSLTDAQVEEVMYGLEKAGLWELKDADSEGLYTSLKVDWNGRHCQSNWHGLSASQFKVSRALLYSPLANDVQTALNLAVQDYSLLRNH